MRDMGIREKFGGDNQKPPAVKPRAQGAMGWCSVPLALSRHLPARFLAVLTCASRPGP